MNTQAIRFLRILSILLLIPLQVAAIYEAYVLFVGVLALMTAAHLAAAFLGGSSKNLLLVWAGAFSLSIVSLIAMLLGVQLAYAVSFFPPILIYGALAIYFGQSLFTGREPVITRLRRFEAGHVTERWARYTRIQTIIWTLLFVCLLILSVLFSVLSSFALWTFFVTFGAPIIILSLFFGEHAFRAAVYGAEGRAHPWRTLRLMSDPHVWTSPDPSPPALARAKSK